MKTVHNAIKVLNVFTRHRPELSLADISSHVAIDKVIVHRMLKTLKEARFVEQDPSTKHYRLGPALGDLAAIRRSMLRPIDHAVAPLLSVHEKIDETIHLSQLEGDLIFVTYSVSSTQELRTVMSVGERLPFYCTGPGLLFLAHGDDAFRDAQLSGRLRKRAANTLTDRRRVEALLPDIRESGIVKVDSTYSDGSKAITAPIFDSANRLIAAASVLGPSLRLQGSHEVKAQAAITAAAQQISRRHGYREPAEPDDIEIQAGAEA